MSKKWWSWNKSRTLTCSIFSMMEVSYDCVVMRSIGSKPMGSFFSSFILIYVYQQIRRKFFTDYSKILLNFFSFFLLFVLLAHLYSIILPITHFRHLFIIKNLYNILCSAILHIRVLHGRRQNLGTKAKGKLQMRTASALNWWPAIRAKKRHSGFENKFAWSNSLKNQWVVRSDLQL